MSSIIESNTWIIETLETHSRRSRFENFDCDAFFQRVFSPVECRSSFPPVARPAFWDSPPRSLSSDSPADVPYPHHQRLRRFAGLPRSGNWPVPSQTRNAPAADSAVYRSATNHAIEKNENIIKSNINSNKKLHQNFQKLLTARIDASLAISSLSNLLVMSCRVLASSCAVRFRFSRPVTRSSKSCRTPFAYSKQKFKPERFLKNITGKFN